MPDEKDIRQETERDDTEAHAMKVKAPGRNEDASSEGTERERANPDADDDVEGHAIRSGR